MSKDYKYNYAFVFYDIADKESKVGKNRVTRVFKICKKYFSHHQKSVFRGNITPSNLLKFKNEVKKVIDEDLDFINIVQLFNESSFKEETIGNAGIENQDLIIDF